MMTCFVYIKPSCVEMKAWFVQTAVRCLSALQEHAKREVDTAILFRSLKYAVLFIPMLSFLQNLSYLCGCVLLTSWI